MQRILLSILAVTVVGSQAFAKQSQRCENLGQIERVKNLWKTEYHNLRTNHQLSFNEKLKLSMKLTPIGITLMEKVEGNSSGTVEAKALIAQSTKIVKNTQKDKYTKDFAFNMLSHTLEKIKDDLDGSVFYAQLNNGCGVEIGRAVQVRGVKARR